MKWLFMLLLFTARAGLAAPWTTSDKVVGAAAASSLVLDWAQTRYIVEHPQQYHETNRLLGEHPDMGEVNRYFLGSLVVGGLIANALSEPYRKYFLSGAAVVEFSVIGHNRAIGVGFRF